jgi:peptidoglycan/LPS O-acetylase OafA/YrhL
VAGGPTVAGGVDRTDVEPSLTPPPGEPRFPLLDSIRGIATLMIFSVHLMLFTQHGEDWLSPVIARFEVALAVFFAMSGFLLYRPFASARVEGERLPSVRDYSRRRLLRIVPAFWLALLVLSLYPGLDQMDTGHWWVFPAFLQQYSLDWVHGGIPVGWSLCVELSFYLLLPLIALGVRRLPGKDRAARLRGEIALVAGLVALSVVYRVTLMLLDYAPAGEGARNLIESSPFLFVPGTLHTSVIGTFDWIAIGMGLAVASVAYHGRERRPRLVRSIERSPNLWWGTAVVVFLFSVLVWPAPDWPGGYTDRERVLMQGVFGLLALLVLAPAIFGGDGRQRSRRFLHSSLLVRMGVISYAFYLYHLTVIQEVASRTPDSLADDKLLFTVAVAIPITLTLAALSYYLFERPILRFKFRRRR